jgi:type II secretory pathway pseudopilin PulG
MNRKSKNKYRLKYNSTQLGFTLIEMLMTVFILIIIVVGATGIYVYSTKAQYKTLQLNIVAQDVQYMFDTISRKVREGEIDYSFYDGIWDNTECGHLILDEEIAKKNVLAIYNPSADTWTIGGRTYNYKGAVIVHKGDHLSVCFCDNRCSAPGVPICGGSSNPFIPLTADSLEIIDLEFKISPVSSPFGLSYSSATGLEQPRMTMRVKLNGAGETMSVQQTVPQRFIERR